MIWQRRSAEPLKALRHIFKHQIACHVHNQSRVRQNPGTERESLLRDKAREHQEG